MNKVGIMQPYFFPYIGYFQLLNHVDQFVIYDNIKYTKKGWINRNRILVNGEAQYISIPLKKDSDFLNVNQRFLSDDFNVEKNKILNKIKGSYRKAPQYNAVLPLIEDIFNYNENNLFHYIFNSIKSITAFLDISTPLIVSSTLKLNSELYKSEEKVIEICKELKATDYINPIGGVELYDKKRFEKEGINLNFIKTQGVEYNQFGNEFVPHLSIIDVLMFNDLDTVKYMINNLFVYESN